MRTEPLNVQRGVAELRLLAIPTSGGEWQGANRLCGSCSSCFSSFMSFLLRFCRGEELLAEPLHRVAKGSGRPVVHLLFRRRFQG
jgi:hypothetical protein